MSGHDLGEEPGSSPYATGGGGVTFERKVATTYLARLLSGDGAAELGDGQRIVSVGFQQAPTHAVDDLVVNAARDEEREASLVLAIGVRRAPAIVKGDEDTAKLITAFVRGVVDVPGDGREHRFALVVAGPQRHAEQLALLARLAANQMSAANFFSLVHTPRKFRKEVRQRLDHVEGLVLKSLVQLGEKDPPSDLVRLRVWELLSRLTVLMPRLEPPDESDWSSVANALLPVASERDLLSATPLRDRLATLAAEYSPTAATVDLTLLRRAVHDLLDSSVRRHRRGWKVLEHLQRQAVTNVRDTIRSADGSRTVHVDRTDSAVVVLGSAAVGQAVLAHGISGVGKSALVLGAATAEATASQGALQVLCLNLRDLPDTTVEFEGLLGCSLAALLSELSAQRRLLVIDGADAIAEGKHQHLRYLIDAAHESDVGVVAVSAEDNMQVVLDALSSRFTTVITAVVPALSDTQIDHVVAAFPELKDLAGNPRSRDLIRRPVVIDLLVRGGVSGAPLSDADAMQQVWDGLIRRRELADRGTPDARSIAMLRLAELSLTGGDALQIVGSIDSIALEGLIRDGLLRRPIEGQFGVNPAFAHDEVRRYAIARLLLTGDPVAKLAASGVPRWTLGAARLACQALLAAPDSAVNPLHRRLERLQGAFDGLVVAGHGDKWGDVPGEALLSIGDPDPVLRDAWPKLIEAEDVGLHRLCRLVDQRLRDETGLVSILRVEPLVACLLDDGALWRSGEHTRDLLRDWLRALVVSDAPAGIALRERLRDQLLAAAAAGDRRLEEQAVEESARLAARSPEEVNQDRQLQERNEALFEHGGPRGFRRRRDRRQLPQEISNETYVELLALLGPDLGSDGEMLLRRIAADDPSALCPAVEEFVTGRALASYQRGLLAHLTESYYLDEDGDGTGFHDEGIRHHHSRSLGVTPLAAWYRGPFMPLFQSDFRNGVALLNRMLNHAALVRARTLAGLGDCGHVATDADLDEYRTVLNICGEPRTYVGDSHVYLWYRGSGVGPYPCMSALQALERVCDQLIELGVPIDGIAARLLEDCNNLAMVGLVIGILVRHLQVADRLLDPFLMEPELWHEEFGRAVSELGGLVASSEGVVAADRRRWSLREVAMFMVVRADADRAAELKAIGERLVENARRGVQAELETRSHDVVDPVTVEESIVSVRAWASGFDLDTYRAEQTDDGVVIQSQPPDEIVQAMQAGNHDLERSQAATRLMLRYHINQQQQHQTPPPISGPELEADLVEARALLLDPPGFSAGDAWDVPSAVAAYALEAHLLRNEAIAHELLAFAADTILRVGEGDAPLHPYEMEATYFERAANRSAARAIPLLLLPTAKHVRSLVDSRGNLSPNERIVVAATHIARSIANEVRVHLARGLDPVWSGPCSTDDARCHHEHAYDIVVESMRDSAFGAWNSGTQGREVVPLADPIDTALEQVEDRDLYFTRFDGAIRALAPASMARICVSARARALLNVLLKAHRRGLLAYKQDMDSRGTHTLQVARALLTIGAEGDIGPIFEHLDNYADNTTRLGSFLCGLSAAAEEDPRRATTARSVWPAVVERVLDLNDAGHSTFSWRYDGERTIAALLPNLAGEVTYLYRELQTDPIVWWDPPAWQATVARWLTVAVGHATCVDQTVLFLRGLDAAQQIRLGLPWTAALVLPDPTAVANRTWLLSSWLIEMRGSAEEAQVLQEWQRVVDALVVAGDRRLAPYAD